MRQVFLAAVAIVALNLLPAPVLAFDPEHLVRLTATGNCPGCDLSGAKLRVARLAGADLHEANLAGADLISADLGGADLRQADLSGANLIRGSLQGARLDGTNLGGAVLIRLHLERTDLSGAIGLTEAQLARACADGDTRVPNGLTATPCQAGEG